MYEFKVVYKDGSSKIRKFKTLAEANKKQLNCIKSARMSNSDIYEVYGVTKTE